MIHPFPTVAIRLCLCGLVFLATVVAAQDEPDGKAAADKTSASRLRAVREIMEEIRITSTAGEAPEPLAFKPDPLLRYNDVTRGILDSCLFRVGTEGRPVALVSAELYGREGKNFLLNHEFVALLDPKVRMQRDAFVWTPPTGNLSFHEFEDVDPPADAPRLRLVQMRRLADRFTAKEVVGNSTIILRRMAAPLDRYQPSKAPKADGAFFAFTWGVNPEALLFIETDGRTWSYGWAPLSSAPLEAKLGDAIVWELPAGREHESRTAAYTSIYRRLTVPDYFDVETEPQTR